MKHWHPSTTLQGKRTQKTTNSFSFFKNICSVFCNRWIGKSERFFWPANSPDLMPHDFRLWGMVNEHADMNQYILVNEGKSVTMHSDDLPLVLIQQTC
jgi:hypothetical protein